MINFTPWKQSNPWNFRTVMIIGELYNTGSNDLFWTNIYKTLNHTDNHCWEYDNELIR